MPRKEQNNPTERIGRLLEEFEELETYVQQIVDLLTGEQILKAPPYPRLFAHHEEKVRRQYTLPKVKAVRSHMRNLRSGQRFETNIFRQRGHKPFSEGMEDEVFQEINRQESLNPKVIADLEKLLKEDP